MLDRRKFIAASIAGTATFAGLKGRSQSREDSSSWIDSHVHVWKHDPRFPFATGATPPAEDASVEILLELMLANHVSRTVLIQVIHYRWDNSYLASVLRRYPKIFHGVCRVDPLDPLAPDHLKRLTEEYGFRGGRLSPVSGPEGDWIRGELMPPLWRRCNQLKVPMTLLLPSVRLADVEPLIRANPDLQVVIDHMADIRASEPQQLVKLLNLAQYPNVFVKLSHLWSLSNEPYPYRDMQTQVKSLLAHFGAARLMGGTDWPISLKQISYAKSVELFRDHLDYLSRQDRNQILQKTVQRVWPFDHH
jgi:L-fuconolactonase